MKTNIITIDEFNAHSGKNFSHSNDCEFKGIISGYICGFNVECEKDGIIDCGSTCFTNDYEEILNPNENSVWNDLGISEDLLNLNGWKTTGNIVFRGYYIEDYDFEERDWYYTDASDEVMNIWNKYICEER